MLCKVETEREAIEYSAAFVQLYREDAWYLERTAPWLERVGLDYIKDRIVEDAESRADLAQRFYFSQSFSQHDPWEKRARGEDAHLHAPLLAEVD